MTINPTLIAADLMKERVFRTSKDVVDGVDHGADAAGTSPNGNRQRDYRRHDGGLRTCLHQGVLHQ